MHLDESSSRLGVFEAGVVHVQAQAAGGGLVDVGDDGGVFDGDVAVDLDGEFGSSSISENARVLGGMSDRQVLLVSAHVFPHAERGDMAQWWGSSLRPGCVSG